METDVLDPLVAVGIFTAGLLAARFGRRADARHAAGLKLSEIRRYVWPTGGDADWIELQTYLGQLRVALRAARVPRRLGTYLSDAAVDHFRSARHVDDVGWVLTEDAVSDRLDAGETWILDWLDAPWHLPRRIRAFRGVSRPLPEVRVHRDLRC